MKSVQSFALASAKSFGDFVIAHSILHRVADSARHRIRLISCSHVAELNAVLPADVRVALLNSEAQRVPALFDLKKRGALAAVQSALSLRREFDRIERDPHELLAFDAIGIRERFIAGRWPVTSPQTRGSNIYATYISFLTQHHIRLVPREFAMGGGAARTVGIFPESRLAAKRLTASIVSTIIDRASLAGIEPKLFILEGDEQPQRKLSCVINIPRNFQSLAAAIKSVGAVISADSLPAHLAEYFERRVFVATAAANEYWLPHDCFNRKYFGIFRNTQQFTASLDRFLCQVAGDGQRADFHAHP